MFEQTFVEGAKRPEGVIGVRVFPHSGRSGHRRDPDPADLHRNAAEDPVHQFPGGASSASASAASSAAAAAPVKVVKVAPRQFDAGRLMAPKTIPKEIAMIKEDEMPPVAAAGVVGGVPGGVPGGTPGGVIGGIIGCRSIRSSSASSSGEGSAQAGNSEADPRRRQRPVGEADQAAEARRIRRWPSRRAFRAWFASTRSSARTERFRI